MKRSLSRKETPSSDKRCSAISVNEYSKEKQMCKCIYIHGSCTSSPVMRRPSVDNILSAGGTSFLD